MTDLLATLEMPQPAAADDPATWLSTVESTFRLFIEPGDVFEIRARGGNNKWIAAGWFDDPAQAAVAIRRYDVSKHAESIGFTANPVDRALFARSPNKMTDGQKETTRDVDVLRRRWLMIDIDPARVSGVSSSQAELGAASDLAVEVVSFLQNKWEWPLPIVAMSGNGYHLAYRVDLPNDEPTKRLLADVLKVLAHETGKWPVAPDAPIVKVDPATFNASRLLTVYGTTKRKGHSVADRPHRKSEVVSAP